MDSPVSWGRDSGRGPWESWKGRQVKDPSVSTLVALAWAEVAVAPLEA